MQPDMKPIYLDYQSTTPVDSRVLTAMQPYFAEMFGNPHSASHAYGKQANIAIEMAREQVAELLGASPKEIIFTSGATESNNIAIKGLARHKDTTKRHVVTLATEHKSVLACMNALEQEGFNVTVLPVQPNGLVNLQQLADTITPDTLLVSVMAVNNEIGVIQPLQEIGALCRAKGALFHVDAAQGFGKIPLNVQSMHIDLLSIAGHKIYAPKGIGALYIRSKPSVLLEPLFSGSNQERGLRPGTVAVPLAVGLGEAAWIAAASMKEEYARISGLRDRFLSALPLEEMQINGDKEQRYPGNLSLRFFRVPEVSLIEALPSLAISTGSACNSSYTAPSHVLQALGLGKSPIPSTTLRIGIGRFTTEAELDSAAQHITEAYQRLRQRPAA